MVEDIEVISGGMGVHISREQLASQVAQTKLPNGRKTLGVVSAIGIEVIVADILQMGDPDNYVRSSLDDSNCPPFIKDLGNRVVKRFTPEKIKQPGELFDPISMFTVKPNKDLVDLTVFSNWLEIHKAKQGHDGLIGINYLEKVQLPHLPGLYGAMLAGVDVVVMGAGYPHQVPRVLKDLAHHQETYYKLQVEGAAIKDDYRTFFNPQSLGENHLEKLHIPDFLPVISSATLAERLSDKYGDDIAGFIMEEPPAGGHNAPFKSDIDYAAVKAVGRPFWAAGSYAHPDRIRYAIDTLGATGVQLGTIFALAEESGMLPLYRNELRRLGYLKKDDEMIVYTDVRFSPTGFPFKIARLPQTLSEPDVYTAAERILCTLGRLRHLYKKTDGQIGYRCPAERVDDYLRKGGKETDLLGRGCLCRALLTTAGFPQQGYPWAVVTLGEDLSFLKKIVADENSSYTVADIFRYLYSQAKAT